MVYIERRHFQWPWTTPSFQGDAILWRWISHKRLKIGPTAIVTIEGEYETAPNLSNGTILNDLQLPDFKVTIIQRQITRKWYNIELYL